MFSGRRSRGTLTEYKKRGYVAGELRGRNGGQWKGTLRAGQALLIRPPVSPRIFRKYEMSRGIREFDSIGINAGGKGGNGATFGKTHPI